MKKKCLLRKNIAASLLLIVLLILCSCSQEASESVHVTQEPTYELIIYIPPNLMFQLPQAIQMFEEEFPRVQVEVRTFTEEHPPFAYDQSGWRNRFELDVSGMEVFNQTLRNGLITNKGPDVVIWYDLVAYHGHANAYHLPYSLITFPDLYKTAAWTELFLDLEPLFSADPRFNREDYVQGVFDAGLIGHRQLFVPLMYTLPLLVTTKEALEYFGLDVDLEQEPTFVQLMEKIEKFIDENKLNPERFLFPPPDRGLRYIYPWVGEPIIDYYLGTVNINSDTFRNAMYSYKMMYEMTTQRSSYSLQHLGGWGERGALWHQVVAKDIYNRNVLFNFTMGYRTFGGTYTQLSNATEGRTPPWAGNIFLNESPVWFPIQSIDGVPVAKPVLYAAIRRGTSNQHNAYEFLRILMSEEWSLIAMPHPDDGMDVYPVNKQALVSAVDNIKQMNDSYNPNAIWWWYLPPQTEERWIAFVQSAVANENFTHTSLRIVYEYMLPFFRGEQTFEESVSWLENKLIIYVGE